MEPTNRAALTYYRNFQKAAEKIAGIDPQSKSAAYKSQLAQLEINLKNIKKIEPGYDTTELESIVTKFAGTINNQETQQSLVKDQEKLEKELDSLFKLLNETKFNADNIEDTVRRSTEYHEKELALFQKKHPSFDTKEYVNKLSEFRDKLRAKLEAFAGNIQSAKDLKEELEKAFMPGLHLDFYELLTEEEAEKCRHIVNQGIMTDLITIIPNEVREERMQPFIDRYENQVAMFVNKADKPSLQAAYIPERETMNYIKANGRLSFEQTQVSQFVKEAIKKAEVFEQDLLDFRKGYDKAFLEYKPLDYANHLLKYYFVRGLHSLFPEETAFATVVKNYRLFNEQVGNLAGFREKIALNRKGFAKTVKMPAAVTQNEETEALVRTAFNNMNWNEEVLKVHLLSHDWKLERNQDFIIIRTYDAAIASRQQSGDCMLYTFTIAQDEINGQFTTPRRLAHTAVMIAEENI